MTAAHSKWSASKFETIMLCPGKMVLEYGAPRTTSKYAAAGTAAHDVLEKCLRTDTKPEAYLGRIIAVEGFEVEVDDDMVAALNTTLQHVADYAGPDGIVEAEQRVCYANYLNVPEADAWGTADVVIARDDELVVLDLKMGQGVRVDVEKNPQLMLYGLGALERFGILGDFTRVRLVISQPRVTSAPSEWVISVEDLQAWGNTTARSAVCTVLNAETGRAGKPTWEDTYLRPGEKQCRFCAAKATCPALRTEVASTVALASYAAAPDDFDDLETVDPTADGVEDKWLQSCMGKVDLIEGWCTSVRAEVERRLLAGGSVPGYKLVQGRRGARRWSNRKEAESLLKTFRLKVEEMYDLELISPTTAEKLFKSGTIGPRQWPRAIGLITQSDGKPSVAPSTDPREALVMQPVQDQFDVVEPVEDFS